MRSQNHRGTLYFSTSKRMTDSNNTRYLFGIGTLNRMLKGYMMSYQQRTVVHVANKIVSDKSGKWMPSMLAFLSSQSKPSKFNCIYKNYPNIYLFHLFPKMMSTNHHIFLFYIKRSLAFTAQLKKSLLQHATFGTIKDVLSRISQYNSYSPFCIQGSASFSSLQVLDIDQRPIIKRDVKTFMTGCFIDFKKLSHVQFSEISQLWHDHTGTDQSNFILAAELKNDNLTDKVDMRNDHF